MENQAEKPAQRPAEELFALLRSLPRAEQDELAASLLAQAKAARAETAPEKTDQSDEKPTLLSFLLSMRDELEDVEFERVQSPARDVDF